MHNRRVRVGVVVLMAAFLFGLNSWLAPSSLHAQEITTDVPVGDFRLLFKEEFILEQIETQLAPFAEGLTVMGMPLSDPSVDFRENNRIDVSVTTELPFGGNPVTVRPTVTVAMTATNNQIEIAIEGVSLEGLALPPALLGAQLEPIQAQAQTRINEALVAVERLLGLELAYIGTTEDLLIVDFNFNLLFYDLGNIDPDNDDPDSDELDSDAEVEEP